MLIADFALLADAGHDDGELACCSMVADYCLDMGANAQTAQALDQAAYHADGDWDRR
jgi:hypothetical protein